MPLAACSITWGLAALRPCPALAPGGANATASGPLGAAATAAAHTPDRSRNGSAAGRSPGGATAAATAAGPMSSTGLSTNKANPTVVMPVDNSSRKPMYGICATATIGRVSKGDILSLELSPKEDGQPVIMVTLVHNDALLLRSALPCASIAALQMYPFITVLVGAG